MSKWGGRQCVQSACSLWFLWGKVSQALLFKLQTQTSHHHQIFHSVLKVVWEQGGVCWGVDESFWSAGRGNRSRGTGKVWQFKDFRLLDFHKGSIFMFVDVESSQFVSLHSDLNFIPPQGAERLVQAITQTPPKPCLTWWLPMGAAMIPSLIPLAFH